MKKYVNGVETEMTAEEVTQREADIVSETARQEAEDVAEAKKATDKVNAKAKLIAGEALTEAEADTIVL